MRFWIILQQVLTAALFLLKPKLEIDAAGRYVNNSMRQINRVFRPV